MIRRIAPALLAMVAAAAAAQTPVGAPTPHAKAIFERDWVLMNWALKFYDRDRDVLLSPAEALTAAAAFRSIADANRDGRVSTQEYRAARQSILARY